MDPEKLQSSVQPALDGAIALISSWGLQVIGAIAVLIIGRWIAALLRRGVRRGLERGKVDAALVPFFASMTYYAALAVVVIAVLNLFGIETTSLVAVLGAAGLAIGLALQGTLSNFSAGVMLLLFRPFKIGDWVEVAGTAGSVAEIGVFTTSLNTGDNIHILIPNAAVYGTLIKNYSANDTRRIDLIMGIGYGDDIGTAIEAIRSTLAADDRVLATPESVIAVHELGDSSVNLVVRPWCQSSDYWGLRRDLTRAMKEQLEAAGCSIPFPQRDVHIFNEGEAA